MPDRLPRIVARLEPELGAAEGEPQPLEGGITNRNFRVRLGGADWVIRLPGRDTALLGIDREVERDATAAAATAGVGPRVGAFLADEGCLVTEFIAGEPISGDALREPRTLAQVTAALRAIHAGPDLRTRFNSFRLVEGYRATALQRGAEVPADYDAAHEIARRIEGAMTGPEHAPVPCHNDLLIANFLDDGARIRILDWEYAGMGDRYFDLANLSVNNGFSIEDDERLLVAYFEEPCPAGRLASVRLMRTMSDFREAMWGVVQSAISSIGFDFRGYAAEHFARLRAAAADPAFTTWLKEAAAHGDRPHPA